MSVYEGVSARARACVYKRETGRESKRDGRERG